MYLLVVHQSIQNKHTHFYSVGSIVHSHPFDHHNTNSANTHNHSANEAFFYQLIYFDLFDQSAEVLVKPICDNVCRTIIYALIKQFSDFLIQEQDTRGPPFSKASSALY
ncbi:MAG TPA: hypothetical protein VFD91_08315 [Mariniphaga sp.]|nr:hypothetical protein [Mariniphaga sp.]